MEEEEELLERQEGRMEMAEKENIKQNYNPDKSDSFNKGKGPLVCGLMSCCDTQGDHQAANERFLLPCPQTDTVIKRA